MIILKELKLTKTLVWSFKAETRRGKSVLINNDVIHSTLSKNVN